MSERVFFAFWLLTLYGFYYAYTGCYTYTVPAMLYTVQVFTYLGHYFAQEKEGGSFLDAPKAIKCYRTALKSNVLNEEAGWGLSELLMCAEGKTNLEMLTGLLHFLLDCFMTGEVRVRVRVVILE